MGKRQLLFITYRDKNLEEGVLYAIAVAKAIYEDINLLLVQNNMNITDRIRNLLTAVSFTDADECDTAREIMAGVVGEAEDRRYEKIISDFPDPYLVSIPRMNRTPKPKSVIRIFTRSPGSIPMMLTSSIRANQ